jgi:hypothetical protein
MSDKEAREYKINIDPRILELLGPSLYTNIYFVLAELIANSYDANASDVYIIQKEDSIVVEDNGTGMSYAAGDIERYLNVAVETRTTEEESYTVDETRRKIGRKGVGKLAALSVSENVLVMTTKNGEKSGFVLSRHVGKDHELTPLEEKEIKFERVSGKGTSIVMTNPEYGMHKTAAAVKKNLLKIFPLVDDKFKIHLVNGDDEVVIDSFDKEMVQALGALITFGDNFKDLANNFDSQLPEKGDIETKLLKTEPVIQFPLRLKNKVGREKNYSLEIKGWIGAYRTTRDRKKDPGDFPDNFISLLSNSKLGEYNILPLVGRNRLPEVYIVGQLHVDLFEETELPDMALSNRQGYKTDDLRYKTVVDYVRDTLLPQIVAMREVYADHQKKIRDRYKKIQQEKDEELLRRKVEEYKATASKKAAEKITTKFSEQNFKDIKQIVEGEMNASLPLIGLKNKVDAQKKKILISHTRVDKSLADIVYKMLVFNDVSDEDIIYTSCDDEGARIPEGAGLFDYLRNFFVDSYSDQKIMVLYVTSDDMARSWFAVAEVGAGWITKKDHKIFNIEAHRPQRPLNIEAEWQTSIKTGDDISMRAIEFDKFIVKIIDVCTQLGFTPKSKKSNEKELARYVSIAI